MPESDVDYCPGIELTVPPSATKAMTSLLYRLVWFPVSGMALQQKCRLLML